MKTLILMRHSHAVSNNPAWTDHDRPLTDGGRELMTPTSAVLQEWPVDQVICSSATRTSETARLLLASNHPALEPVVTKDLYLASPDAYARVAAELADSHTSVLLMIGHNPGIASLIWSLSQQALSVPPGTAAVFRLDINDWTEWADLPARATDLVALVVNGARIR